jgi:ketosteroid isomerase-like protein
MTTASNRDIVQAIFDASAAQDWDVVRSHLHADVRVIEAESLPYAGEFVGPEAFIALNQQVFNTWEDSSNAIHHILADGDHVVILSEMTGRGRGSGESFTVPLAAVWRFEGSKVKEIRPYYFDTKLMYDAHHGADKAAP